MGPQFYKLIGKLAVPCSMREWAQTFENKAQRRVACRVAITPVGPLEVSTIFLGLDHSWAGGPPQLFETMVFGADPLHQFGPAYCARYHTWGEAEAGHAVAVAWAEARVRDAETLLKKGADQC